jgi:rhodanese-related sulfurtransferase
MFSALLTAMLGAFWLDRLGWLDLDLVYLPETFVLPQAIGGALFGAGFLIAGLCPGTSCVAAAAGRRDGLAVMGGLFAGVVFFDLAYPRLEGLYTSTPLGAVTLDQLAGVPRGVMVAAVTGAALAGFARLRASRYGEASSPPPRPALRRGLAVAAATLALAAAVTELRPVDAASLATEIEAERDHISAPDLADLIMRADPALRIFDLRPPSEFARMHVPGASHATIESLAREPLPRDATVVLYSEGGAHAAQAWVLLRIRRHRRVVFLREGMFEWLARVLEPRLAIDATPGERAEFARAVEMSRFFGGSARDGVPRAEVPVGYWSAGAAAGADAAAARPAASKPSTDRMIANVRRRGC